MTLRSRQEKLIVPEGADLAGPHFVSRPGWGGQMKAWLSTHARMLVFRSALVVAAALIVSSFWRTVPAQESPTPQEEETTALSETAARGEGTSHLAARALDRYLAANTQSLTAEERLWAVQVLIAPWEGLRMEPGMTIEFTTDDFPAIIEDAKLISPAQRAKLRQYLQ